MGHKADARLLEAMIPCGITIADQFNPQDIVNLLWALAVLDQKVLYHVCGGCNSFKAGSDGWNQLDLIQLHQLEAFISLELSTEPRNNMSAPLLKLMSETRTARKEALERLDATPSRLQKQVASTLSSMGLDVREEAVDEVSGTRWTHCWTVLDSASPLAPEHVGKCKAGWAVEVEGPSHFVRSSDGAPHCSGSTLLRRRHLEGLGYALVSLPFWEWRAVEKQPAERVRYLRKKLGLRTTGRQNAEE